MKEQMVDASQVLAGLTRIQQQFPAVINSLLNQLAQAIRNEARQIVPVKTRHLQQSIRYKKNADGSYTIYAYTRWGGVSTNYAVLVHENLDTVHKPGKMAKYIERPLLRIGAGQMARTIATELLRRMAANQSLAGTWKLAKDSDPDYGDIMIENNNPIGEPVSQSYTASEEDNQNARDTFNSMFNF